jgi:hypothetical protein
MKEEHINLAFKAKRGNVFTTSIEPEIRRTFVTKVYPKTVEQEGTIRKIIFITHSYKNKSTYYIFHSTTIFKGSALRSNFAFESLVDDMDVPISVIINAMKRIDVSAGEHIVTQGDIGDYFYVVERGLYTVLVDNVPVSQLGDHKAVKSFGELSLIYGVPRQATVRAETKGSLFALDRDTYRYTLASIYERKSLEINEALSKVPLLQNLTPAQMAKLVETVELTSYNEGKSIILYYTTAIPHN